MTAGTRRLTQGAMLRRMADEAATATSHRPGTQRRPPVRRPFVQQGIADVGARFLRQLFENVEPEMLRAMLPPAGLEVRVRMAALPQREPDAVLDGGQIRPPPHPDLAGRRAADGIDAADHLALLVGDDRRLPRCHRVPHACSCAVPGQMPGSGAAIILPG